MMIHFEIFALNNMNCPVYSAGKSKFTSTFMKKGESKEISLKDEKYLEIIQEYFNFVKNNDASITLNLKKYNENVIPDILVFLKNSDNEFFDAMLINQPNLTKYLKKENMIFISHWSKERSLADKLSKWIEDTFQNIKCFCSCRNNEIGPGDWWNKIYPSIIDSKALLALISPESKNNSWIQFEAGIFYQTNKETQSREENIIPCLFNGLTDKSMPKNFDLLRFTAFNLKSKTRFNSLFGNKKIFGEPKEECIDLYQNFTSLNPLAKRIIDFGTPGLGKNNENIKFISSIETETPESFQMGNNKPKTYNLVEANKKVISLRVTIIPEKQQITHWKFGIEFLNSQNKKQTEIQFHSGTHRNYSTWTLYYEKYWGQKKFPICQLPITQLGTKVEPNREHELQIWLSNDHHFIQFIGLDSQRNRNILKNDQGDEWWNIISGVQIDKIQIRAWNDSSTTPLTIQVKKLEIDRI